MFLKETSPAYTFKELLRASGSSTASNVIEVFYDAEQCVLVVNWEGEPGSDEVRKVYNDVMEEVRRLKPRKLLLDLHKRGMIRRLDQRWVFSTFFPQVLRTVGDNVFVAIVLPVTLYCGLVGEMSGDELMHENNFLIIHHALYREEAYRWLNGMDVSGIGLE
ncbi:hypothetical protein GCM10027443_35260 [Pontibacter brevis]